MNTDRRRPAAPRDRQLIAHLRFDDFAEGIIQYGMSMAEPANASRDYLRGREEARQTCISEVIAGGAA